MMTLLLSLGVPLLALIAASGAMTYVIKRRHARNELAWQAREQADKEMEAVSNLGSRILYDSSLTGDEWAEIDAEVERATKTGW
tara:strand:+ start:25728 stop:25979 length:252 start_codon:yes stop_codon:yes gene_type:complete